MGQELAPAATVARRACQSLREHPFITSDDKSSFHHETEPLTCFSVRLLFWTPYFIDCTTGFGFDRVANPAKDEAKTHARTTEDFESRNADISWFCYYGIARA